MRAFPAVRQGGAEHCVESQYGWASRSDYRIACFYFDQGLCALQELACSLRKTNPTLSLAVLSVEGDLSPATERSVADIAELIYVDDITFSNMKGDGRCACKLTHCASRIAVR